MLTVLQLIKGLIVFSGIEEFSINYSYSIKSNQTSWKFLTSKSRNWLSNYKEQKNKTKNLRPNLSKIKQSKDNL